MKYRLFIMKWRLFNIWPLSVTWPVGGSNQIIALCTSSHYGDHLCQVISKHFQQLKVMERTWKCYGQTSYRIGILGTISFVIFFCLIEGQWPLTLLLRNELIGSVYSLTAPYPYLVVRMDWKIVALSLTISPSLLRKVKTKSPLFG
jgi:hypothetical protein